MAVLPPDGDVLPEQEQDQGVRILAVGNFVRIETTTGEVFLGEAIKVTNDSVTLGRIGNFGYEETTIASSDIDVIELDGGDTAFTAVAAILIAAAVLPAIFLLWILSGGELGLD